MVATEAEVNKAAGKRATKYAAALEGGVPIVSVNYVLPSPARPLRTMMW